MIKLLIYNNYQYHYEIIESIIVKYREIIKISNEIPVQIYIHVINNDSFIKYIETKYPQIIFKNINNYDYYINCTIYDKDFDYLDKNINSNKKYISHEITDRLKTNLNVWYLTPFAKINIIKANILPFFNKNTSYKIPIYIIQGNLNQNRRNLSLLIKILDNIYNFNFIIKLVGRGVLPPELKKYEDKIVLKNNLNFIDFHKEFSNAYCIIPLITKKSHPQYYTKKLTSSINYASGYNLKCLIDDDLQNIYKLNNVEIFKNEYDIANAFKNTLNDFYIKNNIF